MSAWREPDVLVIGAGVGGWPAAVGAARCGARVLLVEEDAFAGGAPVDQYVTMPCGGFVTGVYAELLRRLEACHRLPVAANGPIPKLWSRWFMPSAFQLEIHRLLQAEPNIRLLTGVRVTKPLTEAAGGAVRAVGAVLPLAGGEEPVCASVVIDATGHGAFAAAAGAQALYGSESRTAFGEPHAPETASDRVQHCTLMYIAQRLGAEPLDFKAAGLKRGVDPEFGWLDRDYPVGFARNAGIYLTWGGTVACADTRDTLALSRAHAEALAQVAPDIDVLHRRGYTVQLAPRLGVRETRRILGETVLSENDLRAGAMPDDTVAVGDWFLDNWGGEISPAEREVPPYGIPLRALMPRGTRNLLMACRAISVSHLAFSSWRVQPTVAAAGQAAGVTAALAARRGTDVREVPFAEVRKELSAQGIPESR